MSRIADSAAAVSAVESGLRQCQSQSSQRGRGFQPHREVANEYFHRRMPKTIEAKKIHLLQSLLGRPFVNGHAIDGDEDASAIIAEVAVHEDFLFRLVAKKREELDDLFIRRGRPATNWNMNETNAQ